MPPATYIPLIACSTCVCLDAPITHYADDCGRSDQQQVKDN